jgi:hypothetical protein
MLERWLPNSFTHRVACKATCAVVLPLCLAWGTAQALWQAPAPTATADSFHEWPSSWDGAALRPLALGAVEQRFAEHFPGALARMTDGQRVFVLRQVRTPTRMLHPAADCYRALGYRINAERLQQDAQQRLWRCFTAQHGAGAPLQVCERIEAADGTAFTDTSAWYWSAAAGHSSGPWQAVTVATPLARGPL